MKKIEAIIRPTKIGAVFAALEAAGHPGVMISEIEGHGRQKGIEQQFRGKTHKVDFITKGMLQLIVKDNDVENIVEAIRQAAFTGEVGDGKIFIYPVENAIRIRTGEKGEAAL
jgi:nitrogen regulatory protein P-II 1